MYSDKKCLSFCHIFYENNAILVLLKRVKNMHHFPVSFLYHISWSRELIPPITSSRTVPESYSATHSENCIFIAQKKLPSRCSYTKSYPEIIENCVANTPKMAANVGDKFKLESFRRTVANKGDLEVWVFFHLGISPDKVKIWRN